MEDEGRRKVCQNGSIMENNRFGEKWHCKEFGQRIHIKIEESDLLSDFFYLDSSTFPSTYLKNFDCGDCVFIGEDGRVFSPERDENFITSHCMWYIKIPNKFWLYSFRKD